MMRGAYALMMRTTIRLDEALAAEVKQLAARTGRTFSAVVEDALRESLRRRAAPREPVRLTTFEGDGLQPGVDLEDSASLHDLLDEEYVEKLRRGFE